MIPLRPKDPLEEFAEISEMLEGTDVLVNGRPIKPLAITPKTVRCLTCGDPLEDAEGIECGACWERYGEPEPREVRLR